MAPPMREVVLGYDTRLRPGAAPEWLDERRDQYLLRPEVEQPLSVDEAVWPRRTSTLLDRVGLTVETPRFARLEDALAAAGPDEVVVAITQWQGMSEPEVLVDAPAEPAAPSPDWELLGWDVADGFFPSGLSNCGWEPDEELDEARADFAPHVNDAGLFRELPVAFAFRDLTNRRVSEHAPFVVLGLYRVGGAAL